MLRLALSFAALLLVAACSGTAADTSNPSSGSTGSASQTVVLVTIAPSTLTVAVGGTGNLAAQAISATGATIAGKTAAWSSSNTNIAAVAAGVVTGVGAGVALITANIDGKTAVATVTVTSQTVAVVTITPSTLTLIVGGSGNLAAQAISASGATITGKTASWSSSNTGIATVADGVVTGVGAGVALITATIDSKSAVVSVTVNAAAPTQAIFASIAPGGSHTCALNAAGKAYCWGANLYGQLGIGSQEQQLKPVAISGGIAFASISAGANHTCGVALSPKGAAYCWGENSHGELGDGTTTERHAPVLVASGINFFSVSAGSNFTCGLAVDGSAWCWGSGGALGDSSYAQSNVPARVAGGHIFASVSAGLEHACGLTTDGTGYCWGQGQFLGDGIQSDTAHGTPVALAGNVKFRILQTSWAGGCALTQSDQAYCWGQLPRTVFAVTPALLPGGLTFTSLGVGTTASHGCGITAAHVAYCWGSDSNGQTGDGPPTGTNRDVPVAVVGGIAFASIGGGGAHTCGLTASGAAYCWGTNGNGQIGAGPPVGASYFTPTPVVSP